jgi:hypothetical protein
VRSRFEYDGYSPFLRIEHLRSRNDLAHGESSLQNAAAIEMVSLITIEYVNCAVDVVGCVDSLGTTLLSSLHQSVH